MIEIEKLLTLNEALEITKRAHSAGIDSFNTLVKHINETIRNDLEKGRDRTVLHKKALEEFACKSTIREVIDSYRFEGFFIIDSYDTVEIYTLEEEDEPGSTASTASTKDGIATVTFDRTPRQRRQRMGLIGTP